MMGARAKALPEINRLVACGPRRWWQASAEYGSVANCKDAWRFIHECGYPHPSQISSACADRGSVPPVREERHEPGVELCRVSR